MLAINFASLRYRIAMAVVVLTAIMVGYVLWQTLSYNSEQMRLQLNETDNVTMDLLTDLASISLFSQEYDSIQSHVIRISEDPRVRMIYIESDDHLILSSNQLDMMGERVPHFIATETEYWIHRYIESQGAVHVQFTTEKQQAITRQTRQLGMELAIFGVFIIAVVGISMGHYLTKRLSKLTESVSQYNVLNTDVAIDNVLLQSKDEVGELARNFQVMRLHIIDYIEKIKVETEERIHAQSANKFKSDFMANMSHELRTPLNAIIGYSELLMESSVAEKNEGKEDLEKIQDSGRHLLKLIDDILDLSKIEAGKVDITYSHLSFEEILSDVSKSIFPQILKSQNKLKMVIDSGIGYGYFDETKLKQILLNLLSNACKFTDSGEIGVKSYPALDEDKQYYIVEVHDTGIGMTEKQCSEVFMAYKQADSSTTRKFGGTGLGLTISKNYCEMMGGSIGVQSNLSKGSVFTVKIPTRNELQQGQDANHIKTV